MRLFGTVLVTCSLVLCSCSSYKGTSYSASNEVKYRLTISTVIRKDNARNRVCFVGAKNNEHMLPKGIHASSRSPHPALKDALDEGILNTCNEREKKTIANVNTINNRGRSTAALPAGLTVAGLTGCAIGLVQNARGESGQKVFDRKFSERMKAIQQAFVSKGTHSAKQGSEFMASLANQRACKALGKPSDCTLTTEDFVGNKLDKLHDDLGHSTVQRLRSRLSGGLSSAGEWINKTTGLKQSWILPVALGALVGRAVLFAGVKLVGKLVVVGAAGYAVCDHGLSYVLDLDSLSELRDYRDGFSSGQEQIDQEQLEE